MELRYAKDIPADVHRYVEEGIEAGMPEDKAWAIAWSRFCAYKSPGHASCSGGAKDYFPGRKANATTVADRYVKSSKQGFRLPKATITRINATLRKLGMDGNGRFSRMGGVLNDIGTVLAENGLEWDDVLDGHRFNQPRGRANLSIALTNEADSFSPENVVNSMVNIQWIVLGKDENDEDLIEVLAYLS